MSVVAVIGLGYVGLPLVVEFGKHFRTIGFDIALNKVESCKRGVDPSRELSDEEMRASPHAVYTADASMLAEADMIVVAVPTPVDEAHIPDFRPLIGSSTSVGRNMKKGSPGGDPFSQSARQGPRNQLVEAAGIEPASVTGAPPASTCLVPC